MRNLRALDSGGEGITMVKQIYAGVEDLPVLEKIWLKITNF